MRDELAKIIHAGIWPDKADRPRTSLDACRDTAAAVRAFLVSDEAVEAAAISMWQQESLRAADRKRSIAWEDEATDIREKWRQLARASLRAAVGDVK